MLNNDRLNALTAQNLTERVTIMRMTVTQDEELNRVKSYAEHAAVWAYVQPYSASRSGQTGEEEYKTVIYNVVVRYQKDLIRLEDRIIWDGRTLELITPPVPSVPRGRFISVDARELVENV